MLILAGWKPSRVYETGAAGHYYFNSWAIVGQVVTKDQARCRHPRHGSGKTLERVASTFGYAGLGIKTPALLEFDR